MKNRRSILLAQDQKISILATVSRDMPLGQFTYAPYGADRRKTSPDTALGFNGELRSHDGSHYLLGNGKRAFWPSIMRFGTPDFLSPFARGGINSYAFCNNDPVNYNDPSGQNRVPTLRVLSARAAIKNPSTLSVIANNSSFEAVSSDSLFAARAAYGSSIIDSAEIHLNATRSMTPRQFAKYVSRNQVPPEVAHHISSSRTLKAFSWIPSSGLYRNDINVITRKWLIFPRISLRGVLPADSAQFMKLRAGYKSSKLNWRASSELHNLYQDNALSYLPTLDPKSLDRVNPQHKSEYLFFNIYSAMNIRT